MNKKEITSYLWIEKYRPNKIDTILLPTHLKRLVNKFVKDGEIPNLILFSNSPGTGKSSLAKALCNDLGIEYMFINASLDNGIDVIRNRIEQYASVKTLDGKPKIVILDECLEENEEIRIGTLSNNKTLKLKDFELNKKYDIISYNMDTNEFENDAGEIISEKTDEVYEVEFESGKKIIVTGDHPFIIVENNKNIEKSIIDGLNENDNVIIIEQI